jgi:hypothetical protein
VCSPALESLLYRPAAKLIYTQQEELRYCLILHGMVLNHYPLQAMRAGIICPKCTPDNRAAHGRYGFNGYHNYQEHYNRRKPLQPPFCPLSACPAAILRPSTYALLPCRPHLQGQLS